MMDGARRKSSDRYEEKGLCNVSNNITQPYVCKTLENLQEQISSADRVVIYGAGIVAHAMLQYMADKDELWKKIYWK